MNPEPVTLRGNHVHLVPLTRDHIGDLCAVGLDDRLWRWTVALVRTEKEMASYVEEALRDQEAGIALPFATIHAASSRVIGSTRFGNMSREHRRVEIGWTWIGVPWQRTAVNTEAKYLMLSHAFDTLGCERVEFKTDALNTVSRSAIKRLGASEEGTLRHHMLTAAGRWRDTVYYSILREEWDGVRQRFQEWLLRSATGL